MSCKPDITTTEAMHALYQKGYSCEAVAKAFGVSRQTVHTRFKRRCLALRPRQKPLPFIMFDGAKYTRRVGGYYGKTKGGRHYLHRDIWEHHNGPIPPGHDIHHIDGDRANNHLSNLELYTKAEHARQFSTGENQFSELDPGFARAQAEGT